MFRTTSLFGEILTCLLLPLLLLLPLSVMFTCQLAQRIADAPHDQALADKLHGLARLPQAELDGDESGGLLLQALLLPAGGEDGLHFQLARITDSGAPLQLLAGDARLPPPSRLSSAAPEEVHYHDAQVDGQELRVAWLLLATGKGRVLVQLAEARAQRKALAARIVPAVLLPQLVIILLAVVLVWLGLARGIAPLQRLQALIVRRRPTDLSPVPPASVPEEVRPLIVAFNDMMGRLEQTLQAQQRLIGDAAHQMRTPLTGLKMQADLALRESDPEQVQRSLQRIVDSADRAAHLIHQLLALARAESSFEKLYVVEPVALSVLVQEVARECHPRARAKRLDLGVETEDAPLMMEGNPVLLRELIGNLVDNAIKYTPAGGQVTLRTRSADEAVVLEVEDSGAGIAAAERERVFARFYRPPDSSGDGSGLGLPIVREIAELHRARICLHERESGPGTRVEVVFPVGA